MQQRQCFASADKFLLALDVYVLAKIVKHSNCTASSQLHTLFYKTELLVINAP